MIGAPTKAGRLLPELIWIHLIALIVTLLIALQSINAAPPICCTFSGIVTSVKPVQPQNIYSGIFTTSPPKFMVVIDLQSSNAEYTDLPATSAADTQLFALYPIFANIFDEEFHNNFADAVKCRINDLLIWVVSFDDNSEWKGRIEEIAQRMLKLTKEEFNISFEYYISDSCDTTEKLLEDFDILMVEIKQKNENIRSKLFSESKKEEKISD